MNTNYRKISRCIFLFILISTFSFTQAKQKQFSINDKNTSLIGRYIQNPNNIEFDYSHFTIQFEFKGTSCSIQIEDTASIFNAYIDNKLKRIECKNGQTQISLATNLKEAWHSIKIVKITEACVCKSVAKSIIVEGNSPQIKPIKKRKKLIEFIGNSITCGFGNDIEDPNAPFSAETENAQKSFASLIAKNFDAEIHMVSFSGRGVIRNYGDKNRKSDYPMTKLYKQTLASNHNKLWDFKRVQPNMIFIMLGANDFSTFPTPKPREFVKVYLDFIEFIRNKYHQDIKIVLASSPSIKENGYELIKEVVDTRKQAYNDTNICFIGIPKELLITPEDYGACWHPNHKAHKKMARFITPVISSFMKWEER
jgi:lysophospholipase L1-like esterase